MKRLRAIWGWLQDVPGTTPWPLFVEGSAYSFAHLQSEVDQIRATVEALAKEVNEQREKIAQARETLAIVTPPSRRVPWKEFKSIAAENVAAQLGRNL